MEREERTDRFTALEDRFADYEVYDPNGEKIGKVDDLFVDENDQPEYLGVKMGFLGTKSTLIPWEIASANEEQHRIEVSVDKDRAKDGPTFDDDQDITPEYENEVRSYYGLESLEASEEGGGYGEYYDESDEDELRVQRTEEELRAGTREREAGGLNVRKRVRTDREQLRVPKRREEVHVERVPVEEGREASEAEIGEDEVRMPVTEEEVVTEKQPVAKEEVRIRKDAVEEEEVVEEDVRREEVDVDDESTRRTP
jgi:uncharacterized protein (TIGR02271 family)